MLIQDLDLQNLWTKTVSIFRPAQVQKHFIKFNVIFAGLKASVKRSRKVYRFRNIDNIFSKNSRDCRKFFAVILFLVSVLVFVFCLCPLIVLFGFKFVVALGKVLPPKPQL